MRDNDIEDDKKSILEAIVKPLQEIKSNGPYILLDLQHYKQVHLGNMMFSYFRFSIEIYDLKNSHIIGGKDTSGHYEYVNNTNTT